MSPHSLGTRLNDRNVVLIGGLVDYPIWDVGLGGGVLMAIVAVLHVIVSHFAVGGGLVIAVTETLAVRRNDHEMRELARRSSLVLILVSTVFGAISGVGIWVVAGLISPAAISALIHNYVWGWAIEWVFFIVEIVAALVYYLTWGKISKAAHVLVAWVYFVSAYLSLVVINGIITFQLTPGSWLATHSFWDGFFNPTYWPAVVLRTGITVMMAAVFMLLPALRSTDARPRLARYLGFWLVAGTLLSAIGFFWWEAALPDTIRALFLGDGATLPALAATRSFTLWALGATGLLAAALVVLRPARFRLVLPAALVMATAFASFAGYERLREGVRKPFLIHSHLFTNGLRISEIEAINSSGLQAHTGWVTVRGADESVAVGREIFRIECSICHTLDGYQGIGSALPTFQEMVSVANDQPPGSAATVYEAACSACHSDFSADEMRDALPSAAEMEEDPEMIRDLLDGMIATTVADLREMGDVYIGADPAVMIDTRDLSFPYMPPFVGNDDDIEALTSFLTSLNQRSVPAQRGGE